MIHAYDYRLRASAYIPSKRKYKTESENYAYIVSYYFAGRETRNQTYDDRWDVPSRL